MLNGECQTLTAQSKGSLDLSYMHASVADLPYSKLQILSWPYFQRNLARKDFAGLKEAVNGSDISICML